MSHTARVASPAVRARFAHSPESDGTSDTLPGDPAAYASAAAESCKRMNGEPAALVLSGSSGGAQQAGPATSQKRAFPGPRGSAPSPSSIPSPSLPGASCSSRLVSDGLSSSLFHGSKTLSVATIGSVPLPGLSPWICIQPLPKPAQYSRYVP